MPLQSLGSLILPWLLCEGGGEAVRKDRPVRAIPILPPLPPGDTAVLLPPPAPGLPSR